MTDSQNDRLDKIIKKLDQLLSRRLEGGFQIPAFPTEKLDKIIQILERMEAKGAEKK